MDANTTPCAGTSLDIVLALFMMIMDLHGCQEIRHIADVIGSRVSQWTMEGCVNEYGYESRVTRGPLGTSSTSGKSRFACTLYAKPALSKLGFRLSLYIL